MPSLADAGPYDSILEDIARKLFTEKVQKGKIDDKLYKQTAKDLLKTIDEGLGGNSFSFEDGRNTLKAYFQQNICAFSAAKSLTEMNHMRSLLADATDFNDFRNKVFDAGYKFNINWLRTEYDTFTASAQMAQQWDSFIKNGVEALEFTTVGDDRVRPAHALLDGMTVRIDSPALKRIYPPLDWLCRCFMVPGIVSKAMGDDEAGRLAKDASANKLFRHHSGIDKVVVSDEHPYFNAKPKELDATSNYGLPTVKHLYNQNKFPPRIEMGSETEYRNWWRDQVNVDDTDDIALNDKTGLQILFDSTQTPGNKNSTYSYFKDHILMKSNEKRWSYAANLTDIITDADEIWSTRVGNKLQRVYIKYFENSPITVIVKDKDGVMVAETMYELTAARATELRRGELIHIKR